MPRFADEAQSKGATALPKFIDKLPIIYQ